MPRLRQNTYSVSVWSMTISSFSLTNQLVRTISTRCVFFFSFFKNLLSFTSGYLSVFTYCYFLFCSYQDSNSPMLAKLVEPVTLLKQRILFLLKEWDDHPALQKIIEVVDMILALPLDTSLAKVDYCTCRCYSQRVTY